MFHISHCLLHWKFLFVENGIASILCQFFCIFVHISNDIHSILNTRTNNINEEKWNEKITTTTKKKNNPKKMAVFDFGAQCFASIYAYFVPIVSQTLHSRISILARKSHSVRCWSGRCWFNTFFIFLVARVHLFFLQSSISIETFSMFHPCKASYHTLMLDNLTFISFDCT